MIKNKKTPLNFIFLSLIPLLFPIYVEADITFTYDGMNTTSYSWIYISKASTDGNTFTSNGTACNGCTYTFASPSTINVHVNNNGKTATIKAYCYQPQYTQVDKSGGTLTVTEATDDDSNLWYGICGNDADGKCSSEKMFAAALRYGHRSDGKSSSNPQVSKAYNGMKEKENYERLIKNKCTYSNKSTCGQGYAFYIGSGNIQDTINIIDTYYKAINTSKITKNKTTAEKGTITCSSQKSKAKCMGTAEQITELVKQNSICTKDAGGTSEKTTATCDASTMCTKEGSAQIIIPGASDTAKGCTTYKFRDTSVGNSQGYIGCVPNSVLGNENGSYEITCGENDCVEGKDDICDPDCPMDPDCGFPDLDCNKNSDEFCDPDCPSDPDCVDDICKPSDYRNCITEISDKGYDDNNIGHICDADGTTIITYDELKEDDYNHLDYDVDRCCLYNSTDYSEDYTEKLITVNKDISCPIKCTMEYKAIMPGPTKDKKNETILINSGTFFTIDEDNMYDETIYDCHMDINQAYDDLVEYVNKQREMSVELYNRYIDDKRKSECETSAEFYEYECPGGEYVCNTYCCKTVTIPTTCTIPKPIKNEYGDIIDYEYITSPCEKEEAVQTQKAKKYYAGYVTLNGGYSQYEFKKYDFKYPEEKKFSKETKIYTENAGKKFESQQDAQNYVDDMKKAYKENFKKNWENTDKFQNIQNNIDAAINYYYNTCYNWKIISSPFDSQSNVSFTYYDGEMYYGNPNIKIKSTPPITTPTTSTKPSTVKFNTNICTESGCTTPNEKRIYFAKSRDARVTIRNDYEFENEFCLPADGTNPAYLSIQNNDGSTALKNDNGTCTLKDNKTVTHVGSIGKGFLVSYQDQQGQYSYAYKVNINGEDYYDECYYDINSCGQCEVYCNTNTGSGAGCSGFVDTCNSACEKKCVGGGCIVDINSGLLVTYKTISLNNVFALFQERTETLASNSPISSTQNPQTKTSTNWSTQKGKNTKKEIEQSTNPKLEYRFILDSNTIKSIREYNKTNSDYAKLIGTYEEKNVAGYTYWLFSSDFLSNLDRSVLIVKDPIREDAIESNRIDSSHPIDLKTQFIGPAWK